jgi:hypothetical protein
MEKLLHTPDIFDTISNIESDFDLPKASRSERAGLWREYFIDGVRYVLTADMSGHIELENTHTHQKTCFQTKFDKSAKN